MIRHLAPIPAAHSLTQLRTLTRTRFPAAVDVNVVEDGPGQSLAVYHTTEPAPADVTAWRADVAAHTPTNPTPEQTAATAQANQQTVLAQAETGLAQLQAIIDAAAPAAGTLTGAQLSNAVRSLDAAVKTVARVERRLIRLAIGRFDGTD